MESQENLTPRDEPHGASQRDVKDKLLIFSIFFSGILIAGALIYSAGLKYQNNLQTSMLGTGALSEKNENAGITQSKNNSQIIPSSGVVLPIRWGNLGKQLIQAGAIDETAFIAFYKSRGGLTKDEKELIYGENNGQIRITESNAPFLLNLFWVLGLSNKNSILEQGPMTDLRYGGSENFASTGGWAFGAGNVMAHYSNHPFLVLTKEQQLLVENVAKNIYRPCCDNPTHFPDCNHGMAMLGLLELGVSEGLSGKDLYKIALTANSYWFPENYLTIAKYLENKSIDWQKAEAKWILGEDFSSGTGYQNILAQMAPTPEKNTGGCSA